MASVEFKNNAQSTVADNPLTAGATTLNIATGEGAKFPTAFPFKITLWDASMFPNPGDDSGMEIIKCTARTADALTIVRAQEGTFDVEHSNGERVAMLLTAGHFNDVTTGIITKLDTVETNAKDDQIASEVPNTPAGTIVATDVQAAINELDADATLIRNDIDYPTTIKQKAITDTGEDGGIEGGVFNGDFEYGSGSVLAGSVGYIGDEKYGFYKATSASNICSFDDAKLLKIAVTAAGTYAVSIAEVNLGTGVTTEHNKVIPVVGGRKYRLSGRAYFDAGTNVKLRMYSYTGSSIYTFQSSSFADIALTTSGKWKYLESLFIMPANATGIIIFVEYVSTATGQTARFDDIKFEQIDTQTVNTQVDEPVSVSIEGVTTTDNIDQSQLGPDGNTALGDNTNNNRLSQSFIPIESLLTKVVMQKWSNSGSPTFDVTFSIETDNAGDPSGTILASKLISAATWDSYTDGVDFTVDLPCILTVGDTYHIVLIPSAQGDASNYRKIQILTTGAYPNGILNKYDGATWSTSSSDAYFKTMFAKHTESPIVEANGSILDITGVKLLTGAMITVNADGSGRYEYNSNTLTAVNGLLFANCVLSADAGGETTAPLIINGWVQRGADILSSIPASALIVKFKTEYPIAHLYSKSKSQSNGTHIIELSKDNVTYISFGSENFETDEMNGATEFYVKFISSGGSFHLIDWVHVIADLDCQAALPIFSPSSEVTTEAEDLVQNPIDISEDGYWQLNKDLTGWGSRTITMLATEAAFESQAVSANYIYIYDSNGTTPWTWDERSGLVPPADRTSGVVMAKFQVGDNQIKSSVNDGSMKANINLSWAEESLRAAMNRLTELANLQYPIVVEVEDVPAIDLQDQPTGASAETGYTNDVTSLRQTAAGVAAIAYTGLLPRENQFSKWLDITVICSDGDGTLQGKLYTVDGVLIETYADLESNSVITISNPDYKYSRERLILQISASVETTSTVWSVTDIKWRYQYDG